MFTVLSKYKLSISVFIIIFASLTATTELKKFLIPSAVVNGRLNDGMGIFYCGPVSATYLLYGTAALDCKVYGELTVNRAESIDGDWSGQTYKIAKSDSLKHIFQHYSGKCEIQLPRFAFDVHDDLSIDCQQSPSDLGIKNNDTIWVLSCITKSKGFGCHDGTVRYYSHFSGWLYHPSNQLQKF